MPPDVLDAEPSAESLENDPRLDPPWAVWAVLRGWKSWLFRRGTPPTLLHPRRAVRLLRMVTLMGLLGTISTGVLVLEMGIEQAMHVSGVNAIQGLGLTLFPGITFGLFVLVPLSRWQGRNWWLTIPAVPISSAVYYAAMVAFLQGYPLMGSRGDRWEAGLYAGLVGGIGLGVWMNPPFSRRSVATVGLTILMAMIGAMVFALGFDGDEPSLPMIPEFVSRLLAMTSMYAPFHVLVAIALGWRLIWDDPSTI